MLGLLYLHQLYIHGKGLQTHNDSQDTSIFWLIHRQTVSTTRCNVQSIGPAVVHRRVNKFNPQGTHTIISYQEHIFHLTYLH